MYSLNLIVMASKNKKPQNEKELLELADELMQRTFDLVQEELYILLEEKNLIDGCFSEDEFTLVENIQELFYNSKLL